MPVIEEVVCRRDFTMHAKRTLDTIRFSNGLPILCVSLGLGQFLDRIAVQEQDRKLEPFSVSRQQLARLLTLVVNARCVRFCLSVARVDCVFTLVGAASSGSRRVFPPVHFVVELSIVQQ